MFNALLFQLSIQKWTDNVQRSIPRQKTKPNTFSSFLCVLPLVPKWLSSEKTETK